MIFKGEPNLTVIERKTRKALVKFDDNGQLETNDEKLIKRLKPHFSEVIDNEQQPSSNPPKQSRKRMGSKRQ